MPDNWPAYKDVDWPRLYHRLAAETLCRLSTVTIRNKRGSDIDHLFSPNDFVNQAIQKAYSGDRKWDPNRTLFDNFVQIISSDISNLVNSSYNRAFKYIEDEKIYERELDAPSPEIIAIRNSQLRHLLSFIDRKDKQQAIAFMLIVVKKFDNNQDIANIMGIPVSSVCSLRRRLLATMNKYNRLYGISFVPLEIVRDRNSDDHL